MKNIGRIITAIFTLGVIFILASCGGSGLPSTNYEKVSYAFNGVEKALKNQSSSSKKQLINKKANIASSETIDTIYSFLEQDGDSTKADITYNDTPLIQFQYVKALYEELGTDLAFNTKYSEKLTGEIYFDFTKGEQASGNEYLNQYEVICSFLVNIDENNIITCDVGFDMTFNNNGTIRHQLMYCDFYLDYDMKNESPTFEFLIKYIDDALAYTDENEKGITGEYSYIKVEENIIKNYQKFGVSAKSDLSNYKNEDFIYKYSALRGFKDSKNYKITNPFIKDDNLKEAVINGLGIMDTFVNYKSYFNKDGTSTDKIKGIMQKFDNIYGRSVLYSIAATYADEEWERKEPDVVHNVFITIGSGDSIEESYSFLSDDFNIIELFQKELESKDKAKLDILVFQDDYEVLEKYNDFELFDVVAISKDKDKTLNLGDGNISFLDVCKKLGYNYEGTQQTMLEIYLDITLKSNPKAKLIDYYQIIVENADLAKELGKGWPKDYINENSKVADSIPEYETTNGYFTVTTHDDLQICVYDSSQTEVDSYIDKLVNKCGFKKHEGSFTFDTYYEYRASENYMLKIYLSMDKDNLVLIKCVFEKVTIQENTVKGFILEIFNNSNITIPDNDNKEFEIVEDYSANNCIKLTYETSDNIASYIKSFKDYGFEIVNSYVSVSAIKYDSGIIYSVSQSSETYILVNVTPIVISYVGTQNNADVTNTEFDFSEFKLVEDDNELKFSLEREIEFVDYDTFKLVVNRDYNNGEYNYNNLVLHDETGKTLPFYDNFECEKVYRAITVKSAATYTLTATFTLVGQGALSSAIIPNVIYVSESGSETSDTLATYISNIYNNRNVVIPEFNENSYTVVEDGLVSVDMDDENYSYYVTGLSNNGFILYDDSTSVEAMKYSDGYLYRLIFSSDKHISIFKTEVVISLVGSMNDWVVENTNFELTTFDVSGDANYRYILGASVTFDDNATFKAVVNHSYATGEYNFDQINLDYADSDNFESESEYKNIKVITGKTYYVKASFSIGYSTTSTVIAGTISFVS